LKIYTYVIPPIEYPQTTNPEFEMKVVRLLLFLVGFHLVHSQSFLSAISAYPQLSNFTNLMKMNFTLAESLLNTSLVGGEQTILVPSNTAFTKYQQTTGKPFQSSGPKHIQTTLQYHTLNASLTSAILAQKPDIVLSTQLTDPKYDLIANTTNTNSNLNVKGQALYISSTGSLNNSLSASVTSGLGSIGKIHIVDGTWSCGKFQIVDS
jgi:uncharacterized surface protein with fasciclin (FAS1) repeats